MLTDARCERTDQQFRMNRPLNFLSTFPGSEDFVFRGRRTLPIKNVFGVVFDCKRIELEKRVVKIVPKIDQPPVMLQDSIVCAGVLHNSYSIAVASSPRFMSHFSSADARRCVCCGRQGEHSCRTCSTFSRNQRSSSKPRFRHV